MQLDLTGRTALVTGSTAGIGYAIAAGLRAAGAEVVVNGRTQARVDTAVAGLLGSAGGPVRGFAADVATADGCAALNAAVPDVDVLVNNAGFAGHGSPFELPDEHWQAVFDGNVMSGVRLTRHHAARMAQRGWGRVIFVSSEVAVHVALGALPYSMSKTAQLSVSRGFAESVAGTGVTVNSVLPGPTFSEATRARIEKRMSEGASSLEEAGRRVVADQAPTSLIGRMHPPEEVANLVVYLASDQASGTTGAALRVDGGIIPTIV